MKLVVTFLAAATLSLSFTGCASIVSGGPAKVSVKSQPTGARIRVLDDNGTLVADSTTPTTLRLNRGRGYFKSASYRLMISLDGYQPQEVQLTSSVNGWYWGNILFGGLIGMIVVDPLTGSMYTLAPRDIDLALNATQAGLTRDDEGLVVVLRESLPAGLQDALVPLAVN